METMSVLSTINLLPSKKQEAETFAQMLVEQVESGNESALDLMIKMNAIAKSFDTVKDKIKDYALEDALKYGKKFEHIGSEVSISELGTKYDFTVCNDPQWLEATEEIKKWDALKKERETFLKTIKGSINIVTDDGEGITLNQPIKSSTTGIKITLK